MIPKKVLTIILLLLAILIPAPAIFNYLKNQQNEKIISQYEEAADAGNIDAMKKVALMYEDKATNAEDSIEDYEAALGWYLKAYEKGDSSAYIMFKIGNMYAYIAENKGLNYRSADAKNALSWYLQVYNAGDTSANLMSNIGHMYFLMYQEQDAMKWYLKAADAGDSQAMRLMGALFTKDNCKKEMEWYLKAANAGDYIAMQNLAYMYGEGKCVNRDEEIAKQWSKKAEEVKKNSKDKCIEFCKQNINEP